MAHLRAPEGSTLEDWPITYDDLEPYYEKAEWEIGVSGDDPANPFKGAAPHAAAHAAAAANARAYGSSSRPPNGSKLHPVRYSDAAQHGAVQRPAAVHALPLVRGVRLRGECQVRHAEHRHSDGAGHRQLRTAHRAHGPGDPVRRRAAAPPASPTSMARPPADADRGPRDRRRGAASNRRGCCSIASTGCFRTASAIATTGSAATCRATPIPGAVGPVRRRTSTTTSDPAPASPSAITTTAMPGLPAAPCWPTSSSGCRSSSWAAAARHAALGQGAQGLRCAQATAAPSRCRDRRRRCRCSIRASQVDPKVKDRWGIPVARMSGRPAPAHPRDRRSAMSEQGGGVAEGGRRHRRPGRRFPGRGLSGGQHQAGTCRMGNDPEDLGGEPLLPGARRRQRLRDRRQRARHQRRIQSGADHHGERLPRPSICVSWKGTRLRS